ncbi:MAG: phosphate-starvation-inducible PsiE family protein [Methylococcaceae bacterium]|nr:phosphate-starvation-inducible PsiE family protein [Methylococcaceae bacterium]
MRPNDLKRTPMEAWRIMTFYEKFEQIVALILTFIISMVIIASLFKLTENVFLLIFKSVDSIQQHSLQQTFGMIMSVLIALEFKHSILKVVARIDSIIKVKTVILIAILAISRKFIILDVDKYPPSTIIALSASVLSLGVVYWLMRERDDRY